MGSRKRKTPEGPDTQSSDEKSTSDDGSSSSHLQVPMILRQIYEKKIDISRVPKVFRSYKGEDDEDSLENDGYYKFPENDTELLEWWIPSTWRGRKSKKPEVYHVLVAAARCTVEDCLELLKRIGCEDRFISCSLENPRLFFAELNKEEIVNLKASGGIYDFCRNGDIIIDM